MKKIVFSVLFLSFAFALQAQDFIYLRDGSRIKTIVKSVDAKNVLYREYDNADSSLYSLKKSQVLMIAYEKGNVQYFKKESAIIQRYLFKKNLVTYHVADLIINNFTLSYEHLFKNGSMGIQIPISFGYNDYQEPDGFKNNFYSGIYLNFYPTGQGKWRYFLGPAVRLGTGNYRSEWYDYQNHQYIDNSKRNIFYGKLFVNNGVMFTPISSLSLSAVLHLGIRYAPDMNANDNRVQTSGAFSFNMSYRF